MDLHLPDGTPVHIRAIGPHDKRLLAEGLRHVSAESMRRRFLTPKPRLTGAELRYLTEVDGVDHVALVAIRADRRGEAIGVARFVRLPEEPETAEAAVIVADPYQGQGLGRRLGLLLADLARERGIRRFSAAILSDNRPAHRLLATVSARLAEPGARPGRGRQDRLAA